MKRRELRRQTVHILYGLFISALIISLSKLSGVILLLVLFVAGFFLSNVLRSGRSIPFASHFIKHCEREYHLIVRPGLGPLQFTFGALLSLLLFGREIAFISVLVLTFGDSFSTLIGVYFGRVVLPWSKKKTLEGMLACFLASLCISVFLLPLKLAVLVSFVTCVLESFSTRFDDNILIPLGVGVLLWFLL